MKLLLFVLGVAGLLAFGLMLLSMWEHMREGDMGSMAVTAVGFLLLMLPILLVVAMVYAR